MRGVPGSAKAGPNPHVKGCKVKGTFRWPQTIRMLMAVQIINALSVEKVLAVKDGAPLPTHSKQLNAAYERVRIGVRQWLRKTRGTSDKDMPSAAALRKAARRNALKLIRDGHVSDAPPHEKGYKMGPVRLGALRKIYTLLLKGFKAPSGHVFPFRSLKHAVAKSREIAALVRMLDVKRLETVWRMLRAHFPDLYVGKLLAKKKRNNALTQVCTFTTWQRVVPMDHHNVMIGLCWGIICTVSS
jgi:hypothetical protein